MQDSDTPIKIPAIWANSAGGAYITYPVPTPSQIGITNGAASYTDGFPPNNFIPLASGGAGPYGKDFNGLLKQITAGLQWMQAGGPLFHDPTFSALIGGYPAATILDSDSVGGQYWLSTVDNNTSDPDAAGANWQGFSIVAPPGTLGLPVVSNGPGVVPTYRQLDFNAGSPVTGVLPMNNTPVRLLYTQSSAGVYSFTVPPNTFQLHVQLQAAGGGGAGGNASRTGGGGGAGGYAEAWIGVTPGQVLTITVGGGGVGGAGVDGATGGSSSIATYLSASGGAGGQSTSAATGGFPGAGVGATITQFGGWGGDGVASAVSLASHAGTGGASFYGGGSQGSLGTTSPAVGAPGAGGGGTYGSASPGTGNAGYNGQVIIWG